MNDKLKEFLAKLGVSTDIITAFSSTDEEVIKGIDVSKHYDTTWNNIQNSLENNDAFKARMESPLRGKILGSKVRVLIKELGVTNAEYEELVAKDKGTSFDELIKLAAVKAKQNQGGSGDDETSKKKIAELNDVAKQLRSSIANYEDVVIPQIKGQVQVELNDIHTNSDISKIVGKHKLIVGNDVALPSVMAQLNSKYDVKRVDGKLSLKEKGKDTDVYVDNNLVTVEKAISGILTASKLVKESNGNPTPPSSTQTQSQANSNPRFHGMDKARANIKGG